MATVMALLASSRPCCLPGSHHAAPHLPSPPPPPGLCGSTSRAWVRWRRRQSRTWALSRAKSCRCARRPAARLPACARGTRAPASARLGCPRGALVGRPGPALRAARCPAGPPAPNRAPCCRCVAARPRHTYPPHHHHAHTLPHARTHTPTHTAGQAGDPCAGCHGADGGPQHQCLGGGQRQGSHHRQLLGLGAQVGARRAVDMTEEAGGREGQQG